MGLLAFAVLLSAAAVGTNLAAADSSSSAQLLLQVLQSPTPASAASFATSAPTLSRPTVIVPLGVSLQTFGTYNAIVPQAAAMTTAATTATSSNSSLLQSLLAELNVLQADIAALEGNATSTAALQPLSHGASGFTRNLSLHDTGSDVDALQQFLNTHGFPIARTGPGSTGNETPFFGLATYRALEEYQVANDLPATGYFGPQTRSFIAELSAARQNNFTHVSTPLSSVSASSTAAATSSPSVSSTSSAILPTMSCGASSGFTCVPGTNIIQPVAPVGNTPGFGGGGAAPDTTPPVISSIATNSISSSTETVTWTTNEPATSAVSYGTTLTYGSASSSSALSASHSITLTGLAANTTYHFEISSSDASNNQAVSSDQTFTTAAYSYYVDSVNGNDGNAGTSPALAFKNITALPTITAGQSIGLASGSYWRQQLTISANNVTVTGYGSGTLPILDASDQLSNASFTKTLGYTNVYNTATTTFTEGGQTAWANMWETGGPSDSSTGTFLANVSSISSVDSTPCSYYIPTMTTSNMPIAEPIYIHSCDGTSPTSNGYIYEIAQRTGLLMTGLQGKVSNIEARKNADNNGAFDLNGDGNSYTVSGVIARDGGKHNMYVSDGSTVTNSTFINGYYPGGDNMLVFNANVGTNLAIAANNNTFQMDQLIAGNAAATAIFGHTNTSGKLGPVTMNGNWFIAKNGTSLGAENFNVGNVGSISADSDYGSQLSVAFNPNTNLTITNSQFVSSVSGNQAIAAYQAPISISLSNSKFCSYGIGSSQGMIFLNGPYNDTVAATNSTFYVGTTSSGYMLALYNHSTGTNSYTFNGNEFGGGAANWYSIVDSNASSTFAGDNNSYDASPFAPSWKFNNNTQVTSLATWQSKVTPADAHATTTGSAASSACTLPAIPSVN